MSSDEQPDVDQLVADGRISLTNLNVLVCGPADHVLINLGPDAEQSEVDGVLAQIVIQWPELAGRVVVGSCAQIVVVEAAL